MTCLVVIYISMSRSGMILHAQPLYGRKSDAKSLSREVSTVTSLEGFIFEICMALWGQE